MMIMADNNKDAVDSADSPKVDAKALRSARYAALDSRAYTDQAQQLVDHVFMQVMKADRQRAPSEKTKRQIRHGVEGFVGDLLLAAGHEHAKGHVYRSLHASSFTDKDIGRRAFRQIIDQLSALGLLERFRGFQKKIQWEPGGPEAVVRGHAARFRPTDKFMELAASFGIRADNAKEHFIDALPKSPLWLKASKRREGREKLRGRKLRFDKTPKTEKMEAELHELNKFLDGFELRNGVHRGYIRIFNQGDDPEFDWNMGGRLYSRPEENYQQKNEADRLRMTINGEPVCEIDIRASYLTIFLAGFGQELDWAHDPYELEGIPRDIVKAWFVATFGHDKHHEKWLSDNVQDYRDGKLVPGTTGRELGKDYPIKVLRQKLIEKFPEIANWGDRKHAWATLMYRESEAVISTMLRLKREHHIPSLAIHDSLIVPSLKEDIARRVLTDEYRRVIGVEPMLVTSRPERYFEEGPDLSTGDLG
jgi:hypothetical protein